MRIKPFALAVIIMVLMLGGVAVSDLMNLWITSGSAEPTTLTLSDNSTIYNPADIKGSYTFKQVSDLYQVPLEDLLAAYGLNKDKSDIKCKDLEKEFANENAEIGPPSIRMFVAFYKQLPYEATDEYLPEQAVAILKEKNVLTDEQKKYLDTHTLIGKSK